MIGIETSAVIHFFFLFFPFFFPSAHRHHSLHHHIYIRTYVIYIYTCFTIHFFFFLGIVVCGFEENGFHLGRKKGRVGGCMTGYRE